VVSHRACRAARHPRKPSWPSDSFDQTQKDFAAGSAAPAWGGHQPGFERADVLIRTGHYSMGLKQQVTRQTEA